MKYQLRLTGVKAHAVATVFLFRGLLCPLPAIHSPILVFLPTSLCACHSCNPLRLIHGCAIAKHFWRVYTCHTRMKSNNNLFTCSQSRRKSFLSIIFHTLVFWLPASVELMFHKRHRMLGSFRAHLPNARAETRNWEHNHIANLLVGCDAEEIGV